MSWSIDWMKYFEKFLRIDEILKRGTLRTSWGEHRQHWLKVNTGQHWSASSGFVVKRVSVGDAAVGCGRTDFAAFAAVRRLLAIAVRVRIGVRLCTTGAVVRPLLTITIHSLFLSEISKQVMIGIRIFVDLVNIVVFIIRERFCITIVGNSYSPAEREKVDFCIVSDVDKILFSVECVRRLIEWRRRLVVKRLRWRLLLLLWLIFTIIT